MKMTLTTLFVLWAMSVFAQTPAGTEKTDTVKTNHKSKDEVLFFAEEMPRFPGDDNAFQKYLQENIVYPESALKAGKQGTVYVSFLVMKDGKIDSVKLERGIPNAPELGQEAMRVISAMPNWIPGKMNGKAVRIKMTVPIKFELQDNKKRRKKKSGSSRK